MNIELVNIQWYLNYTSPLYLLTIHQLTYQPEVVLGQFPGYHSINLQIRTDHWFICSSTPNYLMMNLIWKNKSGVVYTQYLVVCIILYDILEYHNDAPSSVRDKKFEITHGFFNFHTVGKLK